MGSDHAEGAKGLAALSLELSRHALLQETKPIHYLSIKDLA
jgi:hypothetical protein